MALIVDSRVTLAQRSWGMPRSFLKDEADSLSNEYAWYPPVSDEASVPQASEPSILAEVIAVVVSHAIEAAVAEAKPHVKKLWNDKAVPAIKSARNKTSSRIAKARGGDRQADAAELATFVEAAPADSSEEVAAVLEEDKLSMSSEEAQELLVAALMAKALSDEAKAFGDEQIRTLLNARVEDVDGFLAWKISPEKLTPQEVEDRIHLMLETNPSFLEDFVKMFWRDRNVDGQSVPVTNEEIKEALRLTDGEMNLANKPLSGSSHPPPAILRPAAAPSSPDTQSIPPPTAANLRTELSQVRSEGRQ